MPYAAWAGAVAIGGVLALLDRRWTGWPIFGALLLAGIAGGLIVTQVSPFSFGGGDDYMLGVLVSGGAALALGDYVVAAAVQFASRYFGPR
jgi:hypothetical protein